MNPNTPANSLLDALVKTEAHLSLYTHEDVTKDGARKVALKELRDALAQYQEAEARAAGAASTVMIKHWDQTESSKDGAPQFEHKIEDKRAIDGQTYQVISSQQAMAAYVDHNADPIPSLDLMTEINHLAPGGEHYPCVHVGDGEEVKISVFCTPAGLVIRTDDGQPMRVSDADPSCYTIR